MTAALTRPENGLKNFSNVCRVMYIQVTDIIGCACAVRINY